jgi:hypothetical protein
MEADHLWIIALLSSTDTSKKLWPQALWQLAQENLFTASYKPIHH